MPCPHCQSTATTERPDQTALGYRRFRCRNGIRVFNERTGTPFNRLQYPTDGLLGRPVALPLQIEPAGLGGNVSPTGHQLYA
jgi:hypothetical protein